MSNSMDEILMNSETENEENKGRLSDLPDSILLHILSFMNAVLAVRTCILSTRWKDLWKRLPTLIFHSQDFLSSQSSYVFQYRFLTGRDDSTALQGLDLKYIDSVSMGPIQPQVIVRMVYYAVSHNVQRLGIYSESSFFGLLAVLPCIFTCHTLTSLKLILGPDVPRNDTVSYLFPESMNMPALTTLHLRNFTFGSSGNGRADPFSGLNRLKSLIIDQCNLKDTRILCITSMTLVSLTLHNHRPCSPRHNYYKTELCTPCLHRFSCTECPSQYLYGSGLSSVKEVNIGADLCMYNSEPPRILLSWLRDLVNITSLTVTKRTS
ncbi:putative F-box/FBD/LRR-repeat protein At1g66300 [Lotus japonicus]|uniref:putative F-box/FBD/LRR-repeat protein At1g66300 n=1 Tax=Lotus japonicus TaxID=34305 RepID=UPI0025866A9A|nr:putative F-box/FBD/LRR-repeat protein At1g66300 [Lotus japonicus]